jgi:hypothetical protein
MLSMTGKIIRKDLDTEQKCPECNWLTPVMFSLDNKKFLCGNCFCQMLTHGEFSVVTDASPQQSLKRIADALTFMAKTNVHAFNQNALRGN